MSVWNYIIENQLETFAAVMGLICVILNTRENIWGWFFGILSAFTYAYIFFGEKLYSDVILNIFFILSGIYGWRSWLYGAKLENKSDKNEALTIRTSSAKYLLSVLLIATLGVFRLGWVLGTYTDASLPYWDAATTSFSFLGQWLLAKKYIENWLVWIFVNIMAIGVYAYKGLMITTGLYACFLLLAIYGYFSWRQKMKLQD